MSTRPLDADELRSLREGAERSQAWLARQLGVAANTVYFWERGEWPIPESRHTLIREMLSPVCPACGHDRGAST